MELLKISGYHHGFIDVRKLKLQSTRADRNTPVGAAFMKLHGSPSVCVVPPDNLRLTDIKSPRSKCYAQATIALLVRLKLSLLSAGS